MNIYPPVLLFAQRSFFTERAIRSCGLGLSSVFVARLFELCRLDEKMGVDGHFSSIAPLQVA
jgi:hypothetical protein